MRLAAIDFRPALLCDLLERLLAASAYVEVSARPCRVACPMSYMLTVAIGLDARIDFRRGEREAATAADADDADALAVDERVQPEEVDGGTEVLDEALPETR